MINIPDAIKSILKSGTGYKNIRIRFPNGEYGDIINDNLLRDSVKLRESLCSRQAIKFGVCESPVLSFEVIGKNRIPQGTVIECIAEIECANTVPGSVYRSDIEKNIYPISYGIFIVDECKKNTKMTGYQVTAYTEIAEMSIAQHLGYRLFFESPWSSNVKLHIRYDDLRDLYLYDPANLSTLKELETRYEGFTVSEAKLINITSNIYQFGYVTDDDYLVNPAESMAEGITHKITQYRLVGDMYRYKREIAAFTSEVLAAINEFADGNDIWRQGWGGGEYLVDYMEQYINACHIYESDANYESLRTYNDQSASMLTGALELKTKSEEPTRYYIFKKNKYYSTDYADQYGTLFFGGLKKITTASSYTDRDTFFSNEHVIYPITMTVELQHLGDPSLSQTFTFDASSYVTACYYNEIENVFSMNYAEDDSMFIEVKRVKKKVKKVGRYRTSYSTLTRTEYFETSKTLLAIDIRSFVEAICELEGGFGRMNRDRALELFYLSDNFNALYPSEVLYPSMMLYPAGVSAGHVPPSQYMNLWYDNQTLPFGAVTVSYNDDTYIVYSDGFDEFTDPDTYQIYDISDNYCIKTYTWTEAKLMTILETIISHIGGIKYQVTQLSLVGRPDIEVGDVLEIHAKDETILTIVLERELVGTLALWDNMKAK